MPAIKRLSTFLSKGREKGVVRIRNTGCLNKQGNRTLASSSALNISQFERPVLHLSNLAIFIKFDKKLSKHESNENCQSKSHFSTLGNSLKSIEIYYHLGI